MDLEAGALEKSRVSHGANKKRENLLQYAMGAQQEKSQYFFRQEAVIEQMREKILRNKPLKPNLDIVCCLLCTAQPYKWYRWTDKVTRLSMIAPTLNVERGWTRNFYIGWDNFEFHTMLGRRRSVRKRFFTNHLFTQFSLCSPTATTATNHTMIKSLLASASQSK